MVKIALKGLARAGKDTVGELIQDYLETNGHGHTRLLSFGEELKARFHDAFPEIPQQPKPREGYEKFGKLGREMDENIWVKTLSLEMSGWKGLYQNFVITDLRQPNEAKWCRENGFVLIEVWSPESHRKERSQGDSVFIPVNESEERLGEIKCDYHIHNVGGFDFLEEEVEMVMERVLSHEKPSS